LTPSIVTLVGVTARTHRSQPRPGALLRREICRTLCLGMPVRHTAPFSHRRSCVSWWRPCGPSARSLRGSLALRVARYARVSLPKPKSSAGSAHSVADVQTDATDEWRRVFAEAGDEAHLSLPTAWAAIQEMQEVGRAVDAEEIASQAVGVARRRVAAAEGDPLALRELFVSLTHEGMVAESRERLFAAEAAYSGSLGIARKLVEGSGGSVEAQRDLFAALSNMGRVAHSLGDMTAANAFSEALEIVQKLAERFGEPPMVKPFPHDPL